MFESADKKENWMRTPRRKHRGVDPVRRRGAPAQVSTGEDRRSPEIAWVKSSNCRISQNYHLSSFVLALNRNVSLEHRHSDLESFSCILSDIAEYKPFVCFVHSTEDRRLNFLKGDLKPGTRERLCS